MKTNGLRKWICLVMFISPFAYGQASNCEQLKIVDITGAKVISAEKVTTGEFAAPPKWGSPSLYKDLPEFCRVKVSAKPSKRSNINIEIWLPSKNWNRRYYQVALGGEGGDIYYTRLAELLRQGNAVATSDDGHTTKNDRPHYWSVNKPEKVVDWGYRAAIETSRVAKEIVKKFYNMPPSYRYFTGCSNGGRQALMAAQRMPDSWDGILVGAPAVDHNFFRGFGLSLGKMWNQHQAGRISKSKLAFLQQSALASCGPKAYVVDGIATDPRHCSIDLDKMRCGENRHDTCFSGSEVEALKHIYKGLIDPRTNQSLYPGFPATMESAQSEYAGWSKQLVGSLSPTSNKEETSLPLRYLKSRDYYQSLVLDGSTWEPLDFSIDNYLADVKTKTFKGETLSQVMNPTEDLSKAKKHGIKVLMYFGWADELITPLSGIRYYEQLSVAMEGLQKTRDFFRLFMVPGMSHCSGGEGGNAFGQGHFSPSLPDAKSLEDKPSHNISRALEAWVEQERIPKNLVVTKYVDNKSDRSVEFTRLLCPYPEISVFENQGSKDFAENYRCKQP